MKLDAFKYGIEWGGQRSVVFVAALHEISERCKKCSLPLHRARIAKMCRLWRSLFQFSADLVGNVSHTVSIEPGFLVATGL